jgi:hypothetical protein
LIVARGGFLGIGEKHIAVPFMKFKITGDLDTLVLNVSKDAMDKAPQVDPTKFTTPTTFNDQKQQIDGY